MKCYRAEFCLIRFLKFREKLENSGYSACEISSCLQLNRMEHELSEFSGLLSRPFISPLVMLLIGLIAGASGIEQAWANGIVPWLIYLLIPFLGFAVLLAEIFKSRGFNEKEFELFLKWYCTDAIS